MERSQKLLGINCKSKLISKTPAQDRLKALQKRLQSDIKNSQLCDKTIEKFTENKRDNLIEGNEKTNVDDIIACGNVVDKNEIIESKKDPQTKFNHSSFEQKTVPKKLKNQVSGRIKTSLQNRLEFFQRKTETCSSDKNNKFDKGNEPSHNFLISKNLIPDQNVNSENPTQTKVDSKEPSILNKIKSVWKTVKNALDTDKNVYAINSEKNDSKGKVSKKIAESCISSSSDTPKKTQKLDSYKKISENETKVLFNCIENQESLKKGTTSSEIGRGLDIFDYDYSTNNKKQGIQKRKNYEESRTIETSNKKLKLNNETKTNKNISHPNVQLFNYKNIYSDCSTSSTVVKSSKSNIIKTPLTPVPGKKFSANERLQRLREQINNSQTSNEIEEKTSEYKMNIQTNINPNIGPFKDDSNSNDSDKILEKHDIVNNNLINLVRHQNNQFSNFKKDYLYIVPDTNVFLDNLTFLSDLIKSKLCDTKGSILYIPYIVLQELDKLKMQTERSICVRAARAIKYLNENLSIKNPHFIGQSANESRKILDIDIENPDDHIINCCLQLKSYNLNYILLSNDINLRNKAICNQIICSSKDDLESNENLSNPSSYTSKIKFI
ncbi:transcriptional protein SWT1 [Condylostylus longicornis]|uniref:transcriptional protein SWT1 n=1 Tax=Condylostylus longicornis TaxID=2530218 RepID=UPI00244E248B|nr:transcriptional protein SWT1 [Condylostylus longicornis]